MSFYAVKPQSQALRRAATDVPGEFIERVGGPVKLHLTAAEAAAPSTNGVKTAVTDTGSPQTITTGINNPPYPRCITATSGGTANDIKAIQVVITGTNMLDEVITETLPVFTENSATTVIGTKAFKTVTSIAIPAHDNTGATTAIGWGDKCGLPYEIAENCVVIAAYLGATREGALPTIVVDSDEIEKNTFDLSSALNGSTVDLYFLIG